MSALGEIKALTGVQVAFVSLTATAAAFTGAVIGYKYAIEKVAEKLREESLEALHEEIAKTRDIYEARYKQYTSPEEALEALHPVVKEVPKPKLEEVADAILKYQGSEEHVQNFLERPFGSGIAERSKVSPELVEIAKNVFTDARDIPLDFDYEKEMELRDDATPYIITRDEYYEEAFGYTQTDMMFYEGDGVLVNDDEEVIPPFEINKLIGDHNLPRFGAGSDDENILYIRNVPLELEICIVRNIARYGVSVAGFEDDSLMHSYEPRMHKFRLHED